MPSPNVGHFAAIGSPAANLTYDYRAGVVGVVAVPDGAYILGLTCTATVAGATVQIGAGAAVPLPVGGSFAQDVGGGIRGPVNVTFVNTATYFVDWLIQT